MGQGPISAKDISLIAVETIGWNKNTTYTVIKKLEAKGFIKREDPGFICTPLVVLVYLSECGLTLRLLAVATIGMMIKMLNVKKRNTSQVLRD